MKKYIPAFLFVTFCTSAYAEVISPEEALQRVVPKYTMKIKALNNSQPRLIATRNAGTEPAVYLFAAEKSEGFAVLSADDQAEPLLGYSDSGTVSEDEINPSLEYWLNEYAEEIAWMRRHSSVRSEKTNLPKLKTEATRNEIEPMITSQWDQSAPYNNDCPKDGATACLTGCTATAMAQVVRYHHLKLTENPGQASVIYKGTTYTYDFSTASFDWANMLDKYSAGKYTSEQAAAVANLMYACGVSIDTKYGTGVSLAYDGTPAVALPKYFGFNKACISKLRATYELDTWIDMLYHQLSTYGPVIYSGQSSQGGHAFVCDGYSTGDYFHINWGWGGFGDGYFKLSALDPYKDYTDSGAYNYSSEQSAVINICSPAVVISDTYSMTLAEPIAPVSNSTTSPDNYMEIQSVAVDEQFKLAGFPINTSTATLSGMVGYKLIDEKRPNMVNNSHLQIFTNLGINKGYRYLPITLGSLYDGNYKLIPVWWGFDSGISDWQEYDIPVNNPHYINIRVTSGIAYFTIPEHRLKAELVSVDSPVFSGIESQLTVKLSNNSEGEYSGRIHAVLMSDNGTAAVAQSQEFASDLVPGDEYTGHYTIIFMPVSRASLAAGDYKLSFMDEKGRTISDLYDIKVDETPNMTGTAELKSFNISGNSDAVYRNRLEFDTELANTGGYFVGNVEVGIFDESLTNNIALLSSKTLYVDDNQTVNVHINGSLPDLVAGEKYAAVPYIHPTSGTAVQSGAPVMFVATDVDAPTSVNESVGTAEVIAREVYNLQGVRVDEHSLLGIYIVLERYSDGTVNVSRRIFR